MADGQRVRRTAEEWRQLIQAQPGSGQNQGVFCEARGLGKSTFQKWKRRLCRVPAGATTTEVAKRSDPAPLFTPLIGAREPTPSAAGWAVELDLGDGLCLRLRRAP